MSRAAVFHDVPPSWDWVEKSERFRAIESRCKKSGSGCWHLPISGRSSGYAYIAVTVEGRRHQWLAHRYVWTLVKGAIPQTLSVCHTCDIRNCVNPEHLWLGSDLENQQDRVRKGRHAGNRKIAHE